MKGRISSFQSMGAVDGPGLRFVAFAQGCPLRCAYCHNPETWAADGGSEFTIEQLVEKAERVRPYIKKGGFTLSGGEPLMQPEFAAELFAALRGAAYTRRSTPPAASARERPSARSCAIPASSSAT